MEESMETQNQQTKPLNSIYSGRGSSMVHPFFFVRRNRLQLRYYNWGVTTIGLLVADRMALSSLAVNHLHPNGGIPPAFDLWKPTEAAMKKAAECHLS